MEIDTALNGELALDIIQEKKLVDNRVVQGGYYNYIFLDLQMPVRDGYSVSYTSIN